MKESAVSVKDVSKKYKLYSSPKEHLLELFHPFNKKFHREFWALKGVSLEVPRGQTVGIIGRNGSGKSTLLKIICGVLRPTSGVVSANGRISALLALGAGFNPAFTGRENVLINGALKGFSRVEMEGRMPQIEAFAEIGEFIDQPVKTYSSGMFLRLAFAEAIHVDPDILIVDEALAVGDAKFQQKCYRKFLEFQEAGKTVLFVTHDVHAIARHCDYAVLLENGAVLESGDPNDVVNRYFKIILMGDSPEDAVVVAKPSLLVETTTPSLGKCVTTELDRFLEEVPTTDNCIHRNSYNKNEYRFGDRRAEFVDYLAVCGETYDPVMVNSGDMIEVYLKAKSYDDIKSPFIGHAVKTVDGVYVFATNTNLMEIELLPIRKFDVIIFKFSLVLLNLKPGDYFISFGIAEEQCVMDGSKHNMVDGRYDIIHLSIVGKGNFDGLVGFDVTCCEIARRKATSGTLSEG